MLSVGTVITQRVVELLHQRGINSVKINAAGAAAAALDLEGRRVRQAHRGSRSFYKKLIAPRLIFD
ncbi:MAG: hypothetical protein U1D30_05615 [Planctomycetota bacterium]